MKRFFLSIIVTFFLTGALFSQQTIRPSKVVKAYKHDTTIPLRDMQMIPPVEGAFWLENDGVVPNETDIKKNTEGAPDVDPIAQLMNGNVPTVPLAANFDGVGNLFGGAPPDTDGDIGLDNYVQMINLSFAIYDKEGNLQYGPAANSTIWDGFIGPWTGTNSGDPVVLYDELADRWVFSQFAIVSGPDWELVAVSETSDPLGPYHRYAFQFTDLPDYPKLGVWPDGYYLSVNQFGATFNGAAACVLDRAAMLNGDDAEMIFFDMGPSVASLLPADNDGIPAPAGSPGYFLELRSTSGLNLYTVNIDWNNTANSTISGPEVLSTSSYNLSLNQIPQKGTSQKLDDLSDRLMFRLQYRNFGTHESMVVCHSVNVGSGRAGVRWYEMRSTGEGTWGVYQEGTYAPDDGENRWMGSIAMDAAGNIALGYSVASANTYASIRYTGRFNGDPLGEMTMDEGEIMAGSGSQTGSDSWGRGRYGDYSAMTVDPVTSAFWYTTEYIPSTGTWPWTTRIASFFMEIDEINPDPITDLAVADGGTTSNRIVLTWTATGDDGSTGTAYAYDLRMSSAPITNDAEFDAATQLSGLPTPQPPGTTETFNVENLETNTTYYFAIKAKDDQANYSPLSNYIEASTLGSPEISITPASLDYEVEVGTNFTGTVTVSNVTSYPSTLDFSGELTNNSFPAKSVGGQIVPVHSKQSAGVDITKGSKDVNHGYSLNGSGGPDSFDYIWRDSNEPDGPQYIWNDISTSGTLVNFSNGNDDDGYTNAINIGFPFEFYGNNYSSLRISTNGFVTFETLANSARTNKPIPTDSAPNTLIAAFWDDLDGKTQGDVYYLQEADKFTVQFTNWQKYYSATDGGSSGSYTFQIVLLSNGKIKIYYKEMNGALNEATVGIENPDGTDGLEVAYNSNFPPSDAYALQFWKKPEWVFSNNLGGATVWNGNSTDVQLDFVTENLDPGTYSMDLVLTTNDPASPSITVPITMIVTDFVPVELTSFTAQLKGNEVQLNWTTATETNNSGFEIQRKIVTNGKNAEWSKAGFVQGTGTTSSPTEYSYTDKIDNVLQATVKYRLKQIDLDGTFEYSNIVELEVLPGEFTLKQNYPNPFNPSTTIEYALPSESLVNIAVYNLLGQRVAILVNETQQAGYYTLNWDAANLASGVYIYRMEATGKNGNFFQNKRMILLK